MSDTPKAKSLVSKLAEVMAAAERVPKRGRNEFHKYDYATEADIVATVRQELAKRSVMLIPEIVSETRLEVGKTSSGKAQVLTQLDMTFEFLDGDSNASLLRKWKGCGIDTEDKGLYKAMTGAEKYFLLKTFLLPTGDDPEADDKPNGNGHAAPVVVTAPKGYAEWLAGMEIIASEGNEAFRAEWAKQAPAFREHLTKHDVPAYEALRARVKKASAA